MKHTKGPWKILDHYEPSRILIDSGVYPNSTPVAEIISSGDTKRANAQLIAAAPELLEVCKLMLSKLVVSGTINGLSENDKFIIDLAKKVISDAQGSDE